MRVITYLYPDSFYSSFHEFDLCLYDLYLMFSISSVQLKIFLFWGQCNLVITLENLLLLLLLRRLHIGL